MSPEVVSFVCFLLVGVVSFTFFRVVGSCWLPDFVDVTNDGDEWG